MSLSLKHRRNISEGIKRRIASGNFFTPEHRKRLSLSQIGRKITKEHREKISKTLKGKSYLSEKGREAIRKKSKGRKHSDEVKRRISENHKGENHYRWNKDRSVVLENSNARRTPEYRDWRSGVLNRDNNKCRLSSGDCHGKIIVHHIKPWAEHRDLRFLVSNGVTLCERHHPLGRVKELRSEKRFIKIIKAIKI